MIQTLSNYDTFTAAGLLARLALALDDDGNPASKSVLKDENLVRERIITELKTRLGLPQEDDSDEAIEKVSEALDAESDSLFGSVNIEKTLDDLSKKGRLPSDLYYVQVGDNVKNFYGEKFDSERHLIELTVNAPDKEQHFGGEEETEDNLFSIFTKTFANEFSFKQFTMLVLGKREGKILLVNQAWRLYPDRVDLEGANNLIEVLRRFADAFGITINVDGQSGKFVTSKDLISGESLKKNFEIPPTMRPDKRGRLREVPINFNISVFTLIKGEYAETAWLVIDTDRYRKNLDAHG